MPTTEISTTINHPNQTINQVNPKPENILKTNQNKRLPYNKRKRRHITGNYYIKLYPNETLEEISKAYRISLKSLLRFNELKSSDLLIPEQIIFFRPKKRYGAIKYYTVVPGDHMYLISQKNGIKLNKLYKKNKKMPISQQLGNNQQVTVMRCI